MAKLDELGVRTIGLWVKEHFSQTNHTHTMDSITGGVLAVARGGTGTTSADNAMENLKGTKGIIFSSIGLSGSWAEETTPTYTNYPYYYDITENDFSSESDKAKIRSITSSYYPEVVFNVDNAVSGLFAPVALTMGGGVRIYASQVPSSTVTISTLKCTIYY